jgi:hypothetical protein
MIKIIYKHVNPTKILSKLNEMANVSRIKASKMNYVPKNNSVAFLIKY